MFYNIITTKRDQWLSRPDSPASLLITYIEQRGKMRDAQVDAIKTYLYLKIECQNQPLAVLFKQGKFNSSIHSPSMTLIICHSLQLHAWYSRNHLPLWHSMNLPH